MKGSNTLTSHKGESNSSRSDKMSGWIKTWKKDFKDNSSMKKAKKISSRKRRMFLKNKFNWDKI
jgi:hypothetical protein